MYQVTVFSSAVETHHHLFFECSFSAQLWSGFASQICQNPPSDLHSVAAWINSPHPPFNSNQATLLKLYFQVIIYCVWKERNARIFTSVSTPLPVLRAAVDRLIRDRLLSCPASSPSAPSLLLLYFASYRPP